ncbi:MAG: hypothetical protein CBC24_03300 [Candidatus Pelagibacter sp. TMED64]|nr:short-chain dehydrogenase [Candidatus Pelagibacter sp.]OUU66368.1 MAG: hypothetical protein CBC24_03300 [Candidatus Pelagibacter sp. TMED64]
MNIKGKVIYIAGAGGKIGFSVTKNVLAHGGKVILGEIKTKKLTTIINKFEKKNLIIVRGDHRKKKIIDKSITLGIKKFKKIDGAVDCMYSNKKWKKFENINLDHLKKSLLPHIGSTIIFSQRLIKFFKKQGYGNLILNSSVYGHKIPQFGIYKNSDLFNPIDYSASKAAIQYIVKYLAKLYLKKKIKVNCVSPGGIYEKKFSKNFLKNYKKNTGSKGMLDANDINGTILFLLSDESKFITGQNIVVDDGFSI